MKAGGRMGEGPTSSCTLQLPVPLERRLASAQADLVRTCI